MSGIFGGDTKTKVTNVTDLPDWYEKAAQDVIAKGTQVAGSLAQPYRGNTVAAMDPLTLQAIQASGGILGSSDGAFDGVLSTARGLSEYMPKTFLSGDIDAYMNPWISNVEDAAKSNFQQQLADNVNQIGDAAINAKAFGGSRQGVMEGVAAAQGARDFGNLSAQLRSQGYDKASSMMESDMNRDLAAGQLRGQGAQIEGAAARDQLASKVTEIQTALAGGQLNQDQAQRMLDQLRSQYEAMRNYPLEQLNIMQASTQGLQIPMSSSQTTSQPGGSNWLAGGLGGALTGASLFGTGGALAGLGGITAGGGALGGAVLGGLMALSDRRTKTNIEKLGKDPETGLPLYAYDYKSDVGKGLPKRVGPMAQDIEKMFPGSTAKIGGKMVIKNLGFGGVA